MKDIAFTLLACSQVFGLVVILGLILFNDIVCFNEPKLWIISLEFSFAVLVLLWGMWRFIRRVYEKANS